jgi:hypothetical protein
MALAPVAAPGVGYTLTWPARAGLRFPVERATDLTAGDWTPVATVTAVDATAAWTDVAPPTPQAFYRVVLTLP